MSTVAEIKEAIAKLSPREYCELMAELHPWPDDEWDKQMKADAAAGKFDAMNRRAEEDFKAGRCDPLERMFEEERGEEPRITRIKRITGTADLPANHALPAAASRSPAGNASRSDAGWDAGAAN